jgi:predicted metal-binding membrane protein
VWWRGDGPASPAARERRGVRTRVLLVTAVAWAATAVLMWSPSGSAHGSTDGAMAGMPGMTSVQHAQSMYRLPDDVTVAAVGALFGMWLLMLAAMMTPLLIAPLRHLVARSLPRRRPRAVALFLMGHVAVWVPAGVVLLVAAELLGRSDVAAAIVLGVGVLWQVTPLKQRSLNRHHAQPPIAAFGRRADADAFRFGATHAFWCVGSCWALMLLPLVVVHEQVLVMAAVTVWLWAEQFDKPAVAAWRVRLPVTVVRIARGALVA